MMNVAQQIEKIIKIKKANQLKFYIDFLRFPYFHSIELNSTINFDFPLTIFIGQNGCGKSTCLHAAYGMPEGNTPSTFWFSTSVDPIQYYDDERKRHSFWYSYKDEEGKLREVIKARIRRENDPNYWETSRPLKWAGMKPRKTRDVPIKKEVVYIDFRAELSAFDKYFYFGDVKGLKSKNKQEYIRYQSKHLEKVINGKKKIINKSFGIYNKEIRILSKTELDEISFILGRNYKSAKYIEHTFFKNDGYSVIFNSNFANYSEAFAGSGEVAVVRLVLKILDAPDYSLIILDEPEVSLHPGAQNRLVIFLLNQIIKKKHQIILSTHSPVIAKMLPRSAIKTFYQNPDSGRFLIKEDLTAKEAFYYLEHKVDTKYNITVEDILAKSVVDGVLENIGLETKSLFNVKYNPGGVSVIKKEFIKVFCRDQNSINYVFFDGDQKYCDGYDWRNDSIGIIDSTYLIKKIKEISNEDISFDVDGGSQGGNEEQKVELLKKYLDFYKNNVFYLPSNIPEEMIWDDNIAKKLLEINEIDAQEKLDQLLGLNTYKERFAVLTKEVKGVNAGEDIFAIQKIFLNHWLKKQNDDFKLIKEYIEHIINN